MKGFVTGLTVLALLASTIAIAEARYYDPSTGRFISEDPIGFAGGDVNLSAYARNNPLRFIDPSGLDPLDPLTGRANPVLRCHVCPHDDPSENAIGALLIGGPLVGMAALEVYSGIETYLLLQSATTAGLMNNAAQLFRNGPLTQAGRALTKHPNVVGECGNVLQKLGGAGNVNAAAANALQNIIVNGTISVSTHPTLGRIIDYKLPSGIGARFSATTFEFITFLGRGL